MGCGIDAGIWCELPTLCQVVGRWSKDSEGVLEFLLELIVKGLQQIRRAKGEQRPGEYHQVERAWLVLVRGTEVAEPSSYLLRGGGLMRK